jgi:hypothetical protein
MLYGTQSELSGDPEKDSSIACALRCRSSGRLSSRRNLRAIKARRPNGAAARALETCSAFLRRHDPRVPKHSELPAIAVASVLARHRSTSVDRRARPQLTLIHCPKAHSPGPASSNMALLLSKRALGDGAAAGHAPPRRKPSTSLRLDRTLPQTGTGTRLKTSGSTSSNRSGRLLRNR